MTSPMTQSKPFLPPKPTKYRAPAPPRPQPPSCAARPPPCPRQPPPGDESPPPAEPSSAPLKSRAPCPTADVAPVAIVTSTPPRSMMRREPMQVIPMSNVRYTDRQKHGSGDGTGERGGTGGGGGGGGGTGGIRQKPPSPPLTPVTVNNNNKLPPTTPPTRCHDNDGGKPVTSRPCDDIIATKPVISDVKLVPRGSDARNSFLLRSHHRQQNHYQQSPLVSDQQQQHLRSCRSTESLDRLNLLADLSSSGGDELSLSLTPGGGGGGGSSCRSSFVDPNCPTAGSARRSVYIDLGDYQTLLKHGQQDAVYSLPQPQCYGDDTLRAVRLITEKYDTFKRRQLRALSFRDAVVRGPGRQQSVEGEGASAVITEGVEPDISTVTSDNRPPVPPNDVSVTSSDVTSTAAASEQQQQQQQQRPADVTTTSVETTLSRTIMTLSRYGLESGFSSSSVHDISMLPSPPEVDSSLAADTNNEEERGMTRTDRLRIEMFYRSRETEVYVCSCLADLFLGACGASETDSHRWVHLHTGVPVWLLNTGRAIRRRELVILLADRQTGLTLWRDRISYLSNYGPVDDGGGSGVDVGRIHSLRLSSSLSKAVRLSMFCCRSAAAFLARYRQFTSDPSDDLWKISDSVASQSTTSKTRRRRRRGRNGSLAIRKASISVPCSVVLVTRVDPRHPNFRAAFAHLLPAPTVHCSTSSPPPSDVAPAIPASVDPVGENCGVVEGELCEFRPRLPTR